MSLATFSPRVVNPLVALHVGHSFLLPVYYDFYIHGPQYIASLQLLHATGWKIVKQQM